MVKKQSLSIPGRYGEIRRLCEFIGDGARQAGFGDDGVFQVELACDEACTNIIEHTYGGEDRGVITGRWRVESEQFVVIIEDHGGRFDPSQIPPAPVPPAPPELSAENQFDVQVGGLGVYFMRQLMDEVSFSYEEDSGNVLRMSKQLPEKAE